MHLTHQFELAVAMVLATVALHFVAHRAKLPPAVALIVGGSALAMVPGLPAFDIDPSLVLVMFLPPLLFDSAWVIPLGRLRRHKTAIASLAIGAVVFTTVVVAVVTHFLVPSLPWAACAALGAIVGPPDAVSARAVMQRVTLPRRLRILLEGESLLNDATGLVLFRFAVAAGVTGTFSAPAAIGQFLVLSLGGGLVGGVIAIVWVKLARRLEDEYLVIAATASLSWVSYIVAERLHLSGVIATVVCGLVASWHAHTVMTASARMRGTSFWTVVVFLLEAGIFVLIGLSLRDVIARAGGFGPAIVTHGPPALAVLVALVLARFAWMALSDGAIAAASAAGLTANRPLGSRPSIVLGWAGVRGVVTLALALSVPDGFPGRDFLIVTSFVVILGTVLVQGTTLEVLIRWAKLAESTVDAPRLTLSQAEAAMAQPQLAAVKKVAYDADGKLIHPQLLERYTKRTAMVGDYAERPEHYRPMLVAHFEVVLVAIAAGRAELVRLHRVGDIDDAVLHELERDLDIEELGAIAAMSG